MKDREIFDLIVSSLEAFFAIPSQDRTISPQGIVAERTQSCATNLNSAELAFIHSCVTAFVRLVKLCDGAFKGYCRYCHRIKKSDRYPMLFIAYIIIFKYRDVGGIKVREMFFNCTDSWCITEYLDYLLNIDAVMSTAYPIWMQSYDISFLDSVVLKNLKEIQLDARRDVVAWFRARTEMAGPIAHHPGSGLCYDKNTSSQVEGGNLKTFSPQDSSVRATRKKEVKVPTHSETASGRGGGSNLLPVPFSTSSQQCEAVHSFPLLPSSSFFPPDALTEERQGKNVYKDEEGAKLRDPRLFSENGRLKLPPYEVREMQHTFGLPRKSPIPVLPPPLPYTRKKPTKPVGFRFHQRERSSSAPSRIYDTRNVSLPLVASSGQDVGKKGSRERGVEQSNTSPPRRKKYSPESKELGKPPKTNAAALLREAHMYEKRKKSEEKTFDEMEIFPVDFKSYDRWKEQEKLKEIQQKEINLIERHVNTLKEEAKAQEKKKEEAERRMKRAKEEREKKKRDEERKAKIKQRELEGQKDNIMYMREANALLRHAAKEKTIRKKVESRMEVKQEFLKRKEEAEEKEEAIILERAEIISEIRKTRERAREQRIVWGNSNRMAAWEKPKLHEQFLESMSIMELREELEIARENSRAENESRREMIIEKRKEENRKKEELSLLCQKERKKAREAREAATAALEKNRDVVKAVYDAIEEDHMMALHDKLKLKRAQHREALGHLREMERQHRNKVLLRAEDYFGKEQQRMEQEERMHIKRVNVAQAEYAELPIRRVVH